MNDEIARFQIGNVGCEYRELTFCRLSGDEVGGLEEVFGAEYGKVRLRQYEALLDCAFYEVRAGQGSRVVNAIDQRGPRSPSADIYTELIRDTILLEHIGQPLNFS